MSSENQKKTEIQPYKQDVYETFKLWKCLPSFFKYPPKDRKTGFQPTPRSYAELMGIDDEAILDLVEIRTNLEFASRYDVDKDTLTKWGKQIKEDSSVNDLRAWAIHLSKNVLSALYNQAIRTGYAKEVELWFKLVNEWEDKQTVEHKFIPIKSISHDDYDTIETREATILEKDSKAKDGISVSNG